MKTNIMNNTGTTLLVHQCKVPDFNWCWRETTMMSVCARVCMCMCVCVRVCVCVGRNEAASCCTKKSNKLWLLVGVGWNFVIVHSSWACFQRCFPSCVETFCHWWANSCPFYSRTAELQLVSLSCRNKCPGHMVKLFRKRKHISDPMGNRSS
jgi:hypothetical protein